MRDEEQRHASVRNELAAQGFRSTIESARLEPPSPEMQRLFGALLHDQQQTDCFFGTFAGTVDAAEFFAPENVGRIFGEPVEPAAAASTPVHQMA